MVSWSRLPAALCRDSDGQKSEANGLAPCALMKFPNGNDFFSVVERVAVERDSIFATCRAKICIKTVKNHITPICVFHVAVQHIP